MNNVDSILHCYRPDGMPYQHDLVCHEALFDECHDGIGPFNDT